MTNLPNIPKSATSVLKIAGIESLEDCTTWSARELANLRGFGPKAYAKVQKAMMDAGLVFDESSLKRSDPINVALARDRMKCVVVVPDGPTDLPNIAIPARRALAGVGVHDLASVAGLSKDEVLTLHGVGLGAVDMLERSLVEKGLSFRGD